MTVGALTVALVDVGVSLGSGSVKMTPALVPTQSRSRQASSDVTRRQAILCCRIISSDTDNIHQVNRVSDKSNDKASKKRGLPMRFLVKYKAIYIRFELVHDIARVTNNFD